MTIYEIERLIALRKYKGQNGDIVEFSYFGNGTQGAVTTTFVSYPQMSADYSLRQDGEDVYLKMLSSEYRFIIKGVDDKRIVAFDLMIGDEVTHSFTFLVS